MTAASGPTFRLREDSAGGWQLLPGYTGVPVPITRVWHTPAPTLAHTAGLGTFHSQHGVRAETSTLGSKPKPSQWLPSGPCPRVLVTHSCQCQHVLNFRTSNQAVQSDEIWHKPTLVGNINFSFCSQERDRKEVKRFLDSKRAPCPPRCQRGHFQALCDLTPPGPERRAPIPE